jgi:hypothetical protein
LGEEVVGFKARSFDVGVEYGAYLGFGGVEFRLKGGFVGIEFVIEGASKVVRAGSDFRVEGFAVSMDPLFDQFGEFLVEGVLAGLVGKAGTCIVAESVFLRINPCLETRI